MPTRLRQLYERTPSSSSSIGKFSIPCASDGSARAVSAARLAEALDLVDVREDRELADQDLGAPAPIASRGSIEPSVVTSRTSLS